MQSALNRNGLVAVMAVAIVNGIFSPWVLAVFVLYPVWYPGWLPPFAQLVYMMSALVLSTLTIMLSGVPAAIHERLSGGANPALTMGLWIAGAVLLTLPAVANLLRAAGLSG